MIKSVTTAPNSNLSSQNVPTPLERLSARPGTRHKRNEIRTARRPVILQFADVQILLSTSSVAGTTIQMVSHGQAKPRRSLSHADIPSDSRNLRVSRLSRECKLWYALLPMHRQLRDNRRWTRL